MVVKVVPLGNNYVSIEAPYKSLKFLFHMISLVYEVLLLASQKKITLTFYHHSFNHTNLKDEISIE